MREQRRSVAGGSGKEYRAVRPRVVILDAGIESGIEVLQLAEGVGIGAHFSCRGTEWAVAGERRGSHVLIAQPVNS
jgi:hypothetical protein